ncbi:branched-chain amino acid ABC transporter permease [uncultured Ferrovibrio sp.]|jgi:branched-chain amino acid transport system permease protein|uniref:branched-chain amino acid ABC transporter permease n=1 Tax=uncultured Ferrovibrio sp. TaxID=1576913 RepID=UPI0026082EB1|nr:branched-chain amino acid ABC transporter permease [uncultured Ferrovibrio sp.]
MISRLVDGVPRRALILLGLFLALLLVAPLLVDGYILSILILVLYFAYTGQAWNVMMGFAGQLSLGHSLYVGVAAYTAAALYVHFGIGPWAGVWLAILISVACGLFIGFLAFRFGISGVYFALLTIAFAEFTRVGFDHFDWVNGSGGFFLPVTQYSVNDPLNLRGAPVMFYYILLAITVLAFLFCRWLLTGRIGYYWLAIREEPEAAQTLGINVFRYKMIAVAISAGMTALSGVFFAFYYNNLFPEQIFSMSRSIELILGPIIGGIGSLFGPILGAVVLTVLAESVTEIMHALGYDIPGIKQVFYGLCLLVVIIYLPNGIWPPLRKRLGLGDHS